jgi:hypothetical protein
MVEHTLKSPVDHGGQTYTHLVFREPETGDMMAAEGFKGQLSQTVAILAMVSDVPLPAFKKIKARDLKVILAKTEALLGNEEEGTTGD